MKLDATVAATQTPGNVYKEHNVTLQTAIILNWKHYDTLEASCTIILQPCIYVQSGLTLSMNRMENTCSCSIFGLVGANLASLRSQVGIYRGSYPRLEV